MHDLTIEGETVAPSAFRNRKLCLAFAPCYCLNLSGYGSLERAVVNRCGRVLILARARTVLTEVSCGLLPNGETMWFRREDVTWGGGKCVQKLKERIRMG
jgi:hypothetical protein